MGYRVQGTTSHGDQGMWCLNPKENIHTYMMGRLVPRGRARRDGAGPLDHVMTVAFCGSTFWHHVLSVCIVQETRGMSHQTGPRAASTDNTLHNTERAEGG